MDKRTINRIKSVFWIVLYVGFVLLVWYYVSSFLVDKEAVRAIVAGYGIFASIAFIILQIIQNVFAPIAHYPILLAGGFIFKPWFGFFLNWIGTVIGTCIIVLLARRFGRPLVNKMVSRKIIHKYDNAVKKMSPFGLFLIYALPVFPDDEISYLIGVSDMPLKSIITAIVLGKIPGAALAFMGNEAINGMIYVGVIQILVLIIGVLWYFRNKIFGKRRGTHLNQQ